MSKSDSQSADRPAARRGVAPWVWVVGLVVVVAIGAWGWWQFKPGGGGPTGSPPRNVLLITVDTTRADRIGCYGRSSARTPTLDRLAREGTLFEHCTSCSPMTLPSHSSIMTAL